MSESPRDLYQEQINRLDERVSSIEKKYGAIPDTMQIEDILEHYPVKRHTVVRARKEGVLPSKQFGKIWLYKREHVENWLS